MQFFHPDSPKQSRGGLEGLVLRVVGLGLEVFCRRGECMGGFGPRVHPAQHLCIDSCQQWVTEGEVRTGQACRASVLGIFQASNIL